MTRNQKILVGVIIALVVVAALWGAFRFGATAQKEPPAQKELTEEEKHFITTQQMIKKETKAQLDVRSKDAEKKTKEAVKAAFDSFFSQSK